MITYAVRACFCREHLRLLRCAEAHVERVSNAWGNELRCHELTRAVHEVIRGLSLIVVDGHCGVVEHSWLRFADGVILDVYVPGRLPAVQLVDPMIAAYRPGPMRADIQQEIIDRLVREMRGVAS